MRHLKTGRKLNRTSSHRKALFRNLAAALFHAREHQDDESEGVELRKVADRLITLAKAGTLHATRLAFAYLRDKEVVKKLFTDIGARYADTNGGYTRVLKIGRRKGDAAPMAIIELTQKKEQEKKKEETKKAEAKKEQKKKEGKQGREERGKKKRKRGGKRKRRRKISGIEAGFWGIV